MNSKLLIPLSIAVSSPVCNSYATTNETKAASSERPNILWIIAEDMTLDLGCYGCPEVKTPNLDRLASEGVMYTNARCCAPLSSPTRSAMMTGLHHTITGSHNHRSNRDKALPDSIKPFTYYLRNAGYSCVLGDKDCFENVNNTTNDQESSRKIDCNFKYDRTGNYDGKTNFGLFDNLYDVDTNSKKPFFKQVTLYVTHRGDWWKSIRKQSQHPVNPAKVVLPPYMADHPKIREEYACYLDQVEYMDNEVGMLIQKLEKNNVLDNTIVIFVADNGRADIRAKGFLYDEGTRVPLIIWGKGIKHGIVDELVSELDITASILHLAGVEQPSYYQGKPLNVFDNNASDGHKYLYTARDTWDEVMECIRGVNDNRYVYIRNYFPQAPYDQHHIYMDLYRPALHIMRRLKTENKLNEAQLLFLADSKPIEELYDYTQDPYCINNLATNPEMLSVLNRMRNYMDDWNRNNPDAGIEDRLQRKLDASRLDKNRPRYFVQKYHPEEWKKLQDGEICDKYDFWKKEMKEFKKSNQL